MTRTKILIAGIGGVGGYFGGVLANEFYANDRVEVAFLARGNHLKEIQNNGLKIIKGKEVFTVKPRIATDNPTDIGIADFVLVCIKSYDLETTIRQLKPCISENTIILPLLNGVDSKERIESILPNNIVLNGCVYIISRLKKAGVVENSGNIETLYFGLDDFANDKLIHLDSLFRQAKINATLSKFISTILWEKYIFISPLATATSYFDSCLGEVLEDNHKSETLKALITEVKALAKAKQISVSEDIINITLSKMKSLPFKATSSLHSDLMDKKPRNELETLTDYVVHEGYKQNLNMLTYKKIYGEMKKR
jgi:2-dehydropantoate 2-reductase